MRVDIYRRAESGRHYSYLAVPEGRPIPGEATNVDWESEARGMEMGESAEHVSQYAIPSPEQQIAEKGYAITSVHGGAGAGR
jgi:hypothetical protein